MNVIVIKNIKMCKFPLHVSNLTKIFTFIPTAIRARVESSTLSRNGRVLHKVRVTKFYKRSRIPIGKKIDIEIMGKEITCKCQPLQIRKTYLILGKENSRTRTLFLDDYTYAIEWPEGGKKMAKLHKKRKSCPKRFATMWYPIEKAWVQSVHDVLETNKTVKNNWDFLFSRRRDTLYTCRCKKEYI